MVLTNTVLTPFPYPTSPLGSGAPLTYREGITVLGLIEALKVWIEESVAPELHAAVELAVAEFTEGLTNAENTIIANKLEWQTLFDAFMADVQANIEAMNDIGVSGIINNPASQTSIALHSIFATRLELENVKDDIDRRFIYIRLDDFNILPSNTVDSVEIQELLLNISNVNVYFPDGDYSLTSGIVINGSNVALFGPGKLTFTENEGIGITANGDNFKTSISIDGMNILSNGYTTNGLNPAITKATLKNFRSLDGGAAAIRVANGNAGSLVSGNTISTVHAYGDDIIGNGKGASRAIQVNGLIDATAPNIIEYNDIEEITGEEGDAIQVLFGSSPFLKSEAIVRHNKIRNVSRRGIKIQASNAVVERNTYIHDTLAVFAHPSNVIDIIHGSNIVISENDIAMGQFNGIQVTGNSATGAGKNCVIKNNVISGAIAGYGIFISDVESIKVSENKIYGGSESMRLQKANKATVESNELYPLDATGISINILTDCSSVIAKNNVERGSGKTWFIQNASPKAIVSNNHVLTSVASGNIRSLTGDVGSIYTDNINQSGGTGFLATTYDNLYLSGNTGGKVYHVSGDPTTTHVGISHSRGDVAFNSNGANAGVPYGWFCKAAGTPGTWIPMGNVS